MLELETKARVSEVWDSCYTHSTDVEIGRRKEMAAHVGKHFKYMQAEDSKNIGKPENNDFFFTCHKYFPSEFSVSSLMDKIMLMRNSAKYKLQTKICKLEQVGITCVTYIISHLCIPALIYHSYQPTLFITFLYRFMYKVLHLIK